MGDRMRAARWRLMILGVLACLVAAPQAFAADKYPSRPIRFIVGFVAGGGTDIVARVMSEWMSNYLGQQFVIENRGGSGGNIGAQAAVASPPDGYTILFVAPNNAISGSLYRKLPFDFIRDTVPVAGIMQLANIMEVPPSLPVHSIAEFVAYAKANPGKLSFASSGNGTSVHMSGELFKLLTGVDLVHVPYRGGAAAIPDLMTGKVQLLFDNLPSSIEFVRTGQLRALGVTTAYRVAALPNVPAVGEIIPGFEASVWYGISAPKDTPSEAIDILNKATNAALADPKMKARIVELGGIPMPMTPGEFGKLIAAETDKWAKVVKSANLSVE
jgi:tripartite-type tricarboxylate transporter receptor subunit TctC